MTTMETIVEMRDATAPPRVRQAVVLVGGKGTRLGAITAETPKPLLEIGRGADGQSVRFLDLLLDELARHGFDRILLLAGHLGDQVVAAYDGVTRRGARIEVLREPGPLGTAGALRFAADRLDPVFLMSNGDSFFDFNLRALTARPLGDAIGRIALRGIEDVSRYGAVATEGRQITGFFEKSAAAAGPGVISGGVYLLSRDVLERIPEGPSSIETGVFPGLAMDGLLEGERFEGYFLDIGLPETLERARRELPSRRRRVVFFDRDGVLNRDDQGHTHRVEDLAWMPGARDAVRRVNDSGRLAVVVTNQAGIGKGYYTEVDMGRFHAAMQDGLAAEGAHIDAFYHCPYHSEAVNSKYRHSNHPDRKPNPGMILRAFDDWAIDPSGAVLIGDRSTDLLAAERAGVRAALYGGGALDSLVASLLGAEVA